MSISDLDATHLKILDALQRDASLTNVQLAERVNLSASPCLTRVRALEERGLIRQRVALLDPQKLGLNVNVFIHVSLERQARTGLDAFERAVCALPDVMECYLMTGDADYMIRAVLPDVQGVERLIVDEITRIPGVASIRTSFALKQVLYSTALPLRHLR